MKKLLLILLATVAMLTGCTKKGEPNNGDTILVRNIVMPTGEFMTNDQVTIKGTGFLKGDVISLCVSVKSVGIDAVVTEVTESQLVFTMPVGVASGKANAILKRNVKEQVLGEISVAKIPPVQLYGMGKMPTSRRNNLYKIDITTGKATYLTTIPMEDCLVDVCVIGRTIYGRSFPRSCVASYNLDTKEYKELTGSPYLYYRYPGCIDGKLHFLTYHNGLRLSSFDDTTMEEIDVAFFGDLKHDFGVGGYISFSDLSNWVYDAKNKKIVMIVGWRRQEKPFDGEKFDRCSNIAVLDIEKQTVEYFADRYTYWESDVIHCYDHLFYKDSQLYIVEATANKQNYNRRAILTKLDDQYQVCETLATIENCSYYAYDDVMNVDYGYCETGLFSIDINATPAKIDIIGEPNSNIQTIMVVR